MGIGIIVFLVAATLIGFIIGLCKGFANVRSWGVDYLLATFVTVGVGALINKAFDGGEPARVATGGIITLAVGVLAILLFSLTSKLFRNGFKSSKRKKVRAGGKKSGPSGFFDSIFGGVALAAKGFVIAGVPSAFGLVVLDLAQIPALAQLTGGIFESAGWTAFKPLLMDFFYMAVIMAAIRSGFNSGITSALWVCCVIGMVFIAAYISYHLAFEVETFRGAVDSLANKFAGGNAVGDTQLVMAKGALTGGLFLLMLVVIVLIGIFVPKLLASARNGTAFFVIDGVFGALFALVLVTGVLLFFGSFVQPISDGSEFAFMAKFSSYFESSRVGTFFYDKNIMVLNGMEPVIPVREWLAPVPAACA